MTAAAASFRPRFSRSLANSASTASIAAAGTVMALLQPLEAMNEMGNAQ